ncbi:MAG: MarR family winged helix-turn-helix transcriptional regulator [Acidimicrobiales bacterium]
MTTPRPEEMAASLQRFGLERDRMRAVLASGANISATDLDAIEHLEADGPLTQRQLGDRLSLTSGAITMLVDRLEEGGWVRRRRHPSDRRYILVELSAQAVERMPAAMVDYHNRIRAIAAQVPAQHREALRRFLQAAADAASLAAGELSHPT